ncbi:MAG: four helix bundle protein [Patescibacteria group bacterium]
MIEKTKNAYKLWIPIRRNMDRTERFGIGEKIDSLFLTVMETLREATYASHEAKIAFLGKAVRALDLLRFFLQIAWEIKCIANTQYASLGSAIEEAGRMVGGWRKGLVAKTPPKGGERKE